MSMRLFATGLIAGLVLLPPFALAAAPPSAGLGLPAYMVQPEPAVVQTITEERSHGKLTTVTYAVADLIAPAKSPVGPSKKEDRLMKLILTTIAPRSWSDRGGPGAIDYFPLTMALVVNQTPDIQEQVAGLLASLRRMQDTEVTVELRFLTVSDQCLSKLGLRDTEAGKSSPAPGVALLDDTQAAVLLQTVGSDPSSVITQAPKLTCLNGQKAIMELTDKQAFITSVDVVPMGDRKAFHPRVQTMTSGLRVSVQPAVSPANRSVTLDLAVNLARLDAPRGPLLSKPVQIVPPPHSSSLFLEKTVKIPNGTTALLSGWSLQRETHNEVSAPIVSKLPLMGQLFRTLETTRQKDHLLVLVTPRIVVQQEEERKAVGYCATSTQKEKLEPIPEVKGESEASEETDEPVAALDLGVVYVNNRSFALAYDIKNEGPSHVAGVVVWYTRDGKTWANYPEQVKPMKAIPITVVSDGRYGFTLIARSGAGLSLPAPKNGDEPQVWVEVDTTQPVAELYAPYPESGRHDTLILSWKADDRNLASKPIVLEWSASGNGPWESIAADLTNTGRYAWQVPEDLPQRVYLRLSVRDNAGNVAVAVTHEPVVVDLKVPKVHHVKVKVKE